MKQGHQVDNIADTTEYVGEKYSATQARQELNISRPGSTAAGFCDGAIAVLNTSRCWSLCLVSSGSGNLVRLFVTVREQMPNLRSNTDRRSVVIMARKAPKRHAV